MKIEKVKLSFRYALDPIKKVDKLVLHHPAHKTWGIHDIHDFHKDKKKWSGIGYNYFITKEGRIQEGRGKYEGAHCLGHNDHTLGICFQGDFEKEKMPDAQVKAGGWLIAQLVREYGLQLNDVVGHKDMPGASTACPGKNFRMADVKKAALENINPNTKKEAVKSPTKKEVIHRVIVDGKQIGAFSKASGVAEAIEKAVQKGAKKIEIERV
ncbi:peptidoglycan recognition protein family protein [Peribacillus glennii]|uniref:Autolysin n=1 Tax=Peribacillus glennii TaxID=2303991 RepID=A0A372L7I2_9BACI|nr:peptidoglycan recognition family protein [Peribacillus glennii]RFU61211.1 N-acetylmuramoyl-L-alanine amidase [Peribacillus glennii]